MGEITEKGRGSVFIGLYLVCEIFQAPVFVYCVFVQNRERGL